MLASRSVMPPNALSRMSRVAPEMFENDSPPPPPAEESERREEENLDGDTDPEADAETEE